MDSSQADWPELSQAILSPNWNWQEWPKRAFVKEKRKRPASKSLRKTVFLLFLKIAIALGAVMLIASLCLFYMFWQIGEHEHKRAVLRFGIDETKTIPDYRYGQLPIAKLEYEEYKRDILKVVEGAHLLVTRYDWIDIEPHHVWHCIFGYFGALLGTEEHLDDLLIRFESWAGESGLRSKVAYRGLDKLNIPWQTEFVYEDKYTLYPHYGLKLSVMGESSDREPSPHSHPDFKTYMRLSFRYVDVTCSGRDD